MTGGGGKRVLDHFRLMRPYLPLGCILHRASTRGYCELVLYAKKSAVQRSRAKTLDVSLCRAQRVKSFCQYFCSPRLQARSDANVQVFMSS